MKKLALNFGIYAATFFVGVLLVVIANFFKSKPTILVKPQAAGTQIEMVEVAGEVTETPKVFNLRYLRETVENQSNKHLIETGEVSNGEDFKIKNGETWLGLFTDDEESSVRQTKVKRKQVKKDRNSDLIWSEISSSDKKTPLFLVKDLKKVKAREVETLFYKKPYNENDGFDEAKELESNLKSGFSKEFKLGEKIYKLWTEEGVDEHGDKILVLLLSDRKTSQIVHYINYMGEGEPVGYLKWVGDLDSDGKLDLYMEFWNYEKGSYSTGLFLSSGARKEGLVELLVILPMEDVKVLSLNTTN